MNPIQVTHQLQSALVNYLLTTFDVNRDGQQPELAAALRAAFEKPGHLFNGPYLELTPPYQRGKSVQSLVDEGVLDKRLLALPSFKQNKPLPLDASLYIHQEAAIRRLSGLGRSVVVSSGTGSGKTESFLIPILNDLLVDDTPGVRALLIYPLNALVNDQLERLRELLQGTQITFGRYTSELPQTTKDANAKRPDGGYLPNEVISREQIQKGERLPQILITNYAMLEYLLLRPQDNALFDRGAWRFIVLDEAHSYGGAKGIEVAMLLRRLKLRLGKQPGDVRCIATSATLVNDDASEAITFAQNLFGEEFTEDDIIFGHTDTAALQPSNRADFNPDPVRYIDLDLDTMLSLNSTELADMLHQNGLLDDDDYLTFDKSHTVDQVLFEALERNGHLRTLRQWMLDNEQQGPVSVQQAADYMFSAVLKEQDARQHALYHLIELGAHARSAPDVTPLLPARYHVFARAPQGVWVCLNPNCQRYDDNKLSSDATWRVLYPTPHRTCEYCDMAVYPLAVCRTCGQVYVYGHHDEHDGVLWSEESKPSKNSERRYFVWHEVRQDSSLADPDEDEGEANASSSDNSPKGIPITKGVTLCLKCRKTSRCNCTQPVQVILYQVSEQVEEAKGRQKSTRLQPLSAIERCLRCGDSARIRGSEIATPITVAGNTPISVLTTELYRRLPESRNELARQKPGGGRKLLTFYDSRQGAARFASYLQDVFNQDLYRYMVPQALQDKHKFAPNLDTISDTCVEIGWNILNVFQNDPELLYDDGISSIQGQKRLDNNTRDRLKKKVQKRLLAEITINRKGRQSLETLGLLVVDYDEEWPDLTELGKKVNMTAEQTRLMIRQLLDTVRQEKGVQLPNGVSPDDPVFGQHKGYPALVRGMGGTGEINWFGKTERHRRRRLVERVLKYLGQPADANDIERVMMALWDWLVDESDILVSEGSGKFRINSNRLYFSTPEDNWYRCQKCQRLYHQAGALPCSHGTCGGNLSLIGDLRQAQYDNYYYRVLSEQIIPLRVEEHTAQLEPEKGQHYQNGFKAGDINLLSCSTTFEMGIDLGDLQAVMLNNVPPTVANYRQRAGRAGRRAGGTAFIVTWAQERPHDQLYFSTPEQIIRGEVRVPRIHLDNREIRQRHTNAVLLANFLRQRAAAGAGELDQMGTFFDEQSAGGSHYSELSAWYTSDKAELVARFWRSLGYRGETEQAPKDFINALKAEHERYRIVREQYATAEDRMTQVRDYDGAKAYKKLAERLGRERLIDTLSNHGVLPSYSFPLHTVELELPYDKRESAKLRLQRDLRQAIREYAPGSEVVADKRLWRSGGLRFLRETPKRYHYRLCTNCSYVKVADDPGVEVTMSHCLICHNALGPTNGGWFLEPDGFSADQKSGKAAGQYAHRPVVQMRSALIVPQSSPDWQGHGDPVMIHTSYARDGKLFYVNEGERSSGFRVCLNCGVHVTDKKAKVCKNKVYGQVCGGTDLQSLGLGHTITTDTLHLSLESTEFVQFSTKNEALWQSVLYALLQGASRALQIERQDISGLLYPINEGNEWKYSIVLYDSVPGGAGHVHDIDKNLASVVSEAYRIVSSCECHRDTSCIHCLRDYYNQEVYPYLQRGLAEQFLQALASSLQQGSGIVAINHKAWLLRQVQQAKSSVTIALPSINMQPVLTGLEDTWLDVFDNLLRRGVEVTLLLETVPHVIRADQASLHLTDWLRKLMGLGNGLKLFQLKHLPTWPIMIDAEGERPQVVRIADGGLLLTNDAGWNELRLQATGQPDHVRQAQDDLLNARGGEITRERFEARGVQIHHIREGFTKDETQITEICDFFAQPIVEMIISDPYLFDHERLVNRAGAYIRLAQQGGVLTTVRIYTSDAGNAKVGTRGNRDEQNRAIEKLKKNFSGIAVDVKRAGAEHDRYIEVIRDSGVKARLWIGRGLDFIRPNGQTMKTFLVVEDPYPG